MQYSASQIDLKFDRISMALRRGDCHDPGCKGQAALVRAAEFSDIAPERLGDVIISSEILWAAYDIIWREGSDRVSCFTVPAETLMMVRLRLLS